MKANNLYIILAAAEYSCDTYGENAYGTCSTSSGTNTPPGAAPAIGGFLADTGWNILIPVALGIALIVASLILLVKRAVRARRQHS